MANVSFLIGGLSTEYDASIASFDNIIASFRSRSSDKRPFSISSIYHISRHDRLFREYKYDDNWSLSTSELAATQGCLVPSGFAAIADRNEFVVNLLHGQFGEDGGMQTLAAVLGIQGTFGNSYLAALTMSKYYMSSVAAQLLESDGLKFPKTEIINNISNISKSTLIEKSLPIVVKPNAMGASLLTKKFDSASLSRANIVALTKEILEYDDAVLFQEYIDGEEYSCGCLVGKQSIDILPIVKIGTTTGFFGHREKHTSGSATEEIVSEPSSVLDNINQYTRYLACSLPFSNFVRFDYRVTSAGQIYFLECNYIPGLMAGSIFPKMLNAIGMDMVAFIDWLRTSSLLTRAKKYVFEYHID